MFKTKSELQQAIASKKGKFFSLRFKKKDGSERVACCKNKYNTAIRGGTSTLDNTPYVAVYDVNKGGWISVHPENVNFQ